MHCFWNALEDLGWYVVDNLPPQILAPMVDLAERSRGGVSRLAAVVDVCSRTFFADLRDRLAALHKDLDSLNQQHQTATEDLSKRIESLSIDENL